MLRPRSRKWINATGTISLPKDYRDVLNLDVNDEVEVYLEKDHIAIYKVGVRKEKEELLQEIDFLIKSTDISSVKRVLERTKNFIEGGFYK